MSLSINEICFASVATAVSRQLKADHTTHTAHVTDARRVPINCLGDQKIAFLSAFSLFPVLSIHVYHLQILNQVQGRMPFYICLGDQRETSERASVLPRYNSKVGMIKMTSFESSLDHKVCRPTHLIYQGSATVRWYETGLRIYIYDKAGLKMCDAGTKKCMVGLHIRQILFILLLEYF